MRWFSRAAVQGQPRAQNAYGYSLANSIGTETNLVDGCKWLLLALSRQDPQARVNLAALKLWLSEAERKEAAESAADFRPKAEAASRLRVPGLEDQLPIMLNGEK